MAGERSLDIFALWPIGHGFAAWQMITSAFLHANLLHLFLNMFGLRMFGRDVEQAMGARQFLRLYFFSIVTASAMQLLVTAMLGQDMPTLGASGAVFGVLGAFALIYPQRIILLVFPPIPMPAYLFVVAYAAIELITGVFNTDAGIAHFAHLGGLAGGMLSVGHWRRLRGEGQFFTDI